MKKFRILLGRNQKLKLMQTQVTKLDFTGQNIYSGIDAHLKRWSVTIMVEGIQCKTFSQNPDAGTLKNYLSKKLSRG